jgi:site-specific DNA recombinase
MKKKPTQAQQEIKAAIYCRVSTYEQGKGEFSSLDSQENILRQYCEMKRYVVYDVYRDTVSGTTLDRQYLNKLLQDALAGKFTVLVVTKFDRISRNVKDFLDLDDTLGKLGIDIVVTTQNLDTTSSQGKMMRTILVAFAQFERDMIAERTREKLYNQAKSGYWGGGHVLLGYDAIEKKLVVNRNEADLVRRAFEQYLHSPSTKKVAAWLNEQGYRTKVRTTKSGKTTGGKAFNHQLIHDLLRNKIYIGLIKYQDETFKGLHEPIVEEELFDKVQKRLDESVLDRYATYEDSPLLLLGLTKCGFCENQLTTFYAQKKKSALRHFYYKCTSISKFGSDKCPSRNLPAHQLENFTTKLLLHTASDDEFFEAVVKQVMGNATESLASKTSQRADLSVNLSSVKKQVNTFVSNLAMMQLKPEEGSEMKTKIEGLQKQAKNLEQQLNALDLEIERLDAQQIDKKQLRRVFQEFADIYSEASAEIKRRLLNVMIEEIRCSVKRGEKTGEIVYKLRGDGSIKKDWEEAKKNEEPGNPQFGGLTPRVAWLRVSYRGMTISNIRKRVRNVNDASVLDLRSLLFRWSSFPPPPETFGGTPLQQVRHRNPWQGGDCFLSWTLVARECPKLGQYSLRAWLDCGVPPTNSWPVPLGNLQPLGSSW